MARPIARALAENALDAVEQLVDHFKDTPPSLHASGTDSQQAQPARLAAATCAEGAIALLTVLHALVDELPGLTDEQRERRRCQLADDADSAVRAVARAAQSLASLPP